MAATDEKGDAPPQTITQRIYSAAESFIHTALVYASPLFPPEYQDKLKQAYQTRPYISTFLTVQVILLLLPVTILASLLFTLSFALTILALITFLFWSGILLLSSIPILLFTLVIGTFIWGWGAAAYSLYLFAGIGKEMVLGDGNRDTANVVREAVREKVERVKEEVEADMESRSGQKNIKREDGPVRDAPLVVPSADGVIGKEQASLPAFEAGKGGPGKIAGVEDHVPGKKEAEFNTEEELYEPQEPVTLANGGDDVMRSISRSLN